MVERKLETIGCRSINNVVDVTNYIMFAYGQPLHCFDADMIEGKKVVVRTMPEGTPFVTLDGEEHKLSERDLAIAMQRLLCVLPAFLAARVLALMRPPRTCSWKAPISTQRGFVRAPAVMV